jgi:hypothetical protein
MTNNEFRESFGRLESAFGEQGAERRQFYFHQFESSPYWIFKRAITRMIETRSEDTYGFPLVSEIHMAVERVERERSTADGADWEAREYCQQCANHGFFLTERGTAAFCACRAGRLKQARMRLGLSARRSEVDEYVKTKLPLPEPPVRGLQEKNPLGFWEDTQAEHDRHMTAKRAEIEEIKRRQAEHPRGPTLPDEIRRRLLKDTVAGVRGRMTVPIMREPGEDEEEDAVPF